MEEKKDEMSSQEIAVLVKQVSQFHPIGALCNILMMGVIGAGMFGFFFRDKAFYGVAIFIALGFLVRFLIMSVLNLYLRRKYKSVIDC